MNREYDENKLLSIGVHENTIQALHRKYENTKYNFINSERFLASVQKDWYHYSEMFSDEPDENYVHHWIEQYKEAVKDWFLMMLKTEPAKIEVGEKATVYYYSDRRAATIKTVEYYKNGKKDEVGNLIPKRIGVVLNPDVKCNDYYDGDYTVNPISKEDLNEMEVKYYFTLRTRGAAGFVSEGYQVNDGLLLGIGFWNHYIDPSF